jgi:hypothetical protein
MALVPAQGMSRAVIEDLDLGPYMINAAKARAAQASKYKIPTGGAWERDTQFQNILLTKSAQIISDPSLSDAQKNLYLSQTAAALQKSQKYGQEYDQTYDAVAKGAGSGDKGSPFDEETLEYHTLQRNPSVWSAANLSPNDISFDPVTGAVLIKGKSMDDFSYQTEVKTDDGKVYNLDIRPFGPIEIPQQSLDPFTTLIKGIRIPYTTNETGDVTIRQYDPEKTMTQIAEFVSNNIRGKRVLREFSSSILNQQGITLENTPKKEFEALLSSNELQAQAVKEMNDLIRSRSDYARTLDEARSGAGSAAKKAGIRAFTEVREGKEVLRNNFSIGKDKETDKEVTVQGQAVEFPALAVKPSGPKQQALVVSLGGITSDGRLILGGRTVSANILEKSIGNQTALEKLIGDTGVSDFIATPEQANAFLAEFAKQHGYNQQLSIADFVGIIKEYGGKFANGIPVPTGIGNLNP